jgi:hypothetical protein
MRNVVMIRREPGLVSIPVENAVYCGNCETVSTSAIRSRLQQNSCPRWDSHIGARLCAGVANARHGADSLQPRVPR